MATATLTPAATTASLFSFAHADTQDFTDFYAILDLTKNEWVQGHWVTVAEGSTPAQVEAAFNQGDLVTGI